jgi:trimethylamine--corrinoid protein Co-methyltransferase
MVSERSRLRLLERSDLEAIHGATMEVLEKTGVFVDSQETLALLQKNGYEVDKKSKIVCMSESSVMDAVKSCKKNWKWHARSDKHSVDMIDGRTKFGPGSQCLFFLDPDTREIRSSTLQDGISICRLLDALDSCSLGYIPTHLHDVPPEVMSVVMWMAGLVNSSKLTYGSSGDKAELDLMLRIVEILFGDRRELGRKNVYPGYIDPISPLGHDRYMIETLLRHAELDSPVFVMVMALAGGTGPASLAGLLVQQNAEILSSVAIAKCVTKAPKIVYGSVSCPLDMRSGIAATGAPEFSLIGAGSVQLAQYYGLPSDVGVQSDSKTVDAQTTYEKTQSALTAVLAGADFAELFMGSTETFNCYSPVQLIIDDEIASNVSRIAQGIEVNEETLSVNVISKIGPMGNFLKHKRTLKQFKKEHLAAKLSDRSTRQQWTASGSRDTNRRAKERAVSLLATHVPEPLDPDVRKRMDNLLSEYSKEYSLSKLERLVH